MQFSHTNEVAIFKVSKKLFKINASNLWSIFYLNMKEGCFAFSLKFAHLYQ